MGFGAGSRYGSPLGCNGREPLKTDDGDSRALRYERQTLERLRVVGCPSPTGGMRRADLICTETSERGVGQFPALVLD